MNDAELVYDKRIQANITTDLKNCVRELVKSQKYESESEIVRQALWRFVNQPQITTPPSPAATPQQPDTQMHHDLKGRMDILAWMLTLILMLLATIGSKLLKTQTGENITPLQLLDQANLTAVQNRDTLRRKLAVGWHSFHQGSLISRQGANNTATTPDRLQ